MLVGCDCGLMLTAEAVETATGKGILYRVADQVQAPVLATCPKCGRLLPGAVVGTAIGPMVEQLQASGTE